eukprot:SAG22_NODE_1999_length_3178_cov_12.473530_4_plen_112_part_00
MCAFAAFHCGSTNDVLLAAAAKALVSLAATTDEKAAVILKWMAEAGALAALVRQVRFPKTVSRAIPSLRIILRTLLLASALRVLCEFSSTHNTSASSIHCRPPHAPCVRVL